MQASDPAAGIPPSTAAVGALLLLAVLQLNTCQQHSQALTFQLRVCCWLVPPALLHPVPAGSEARRLARCCCWFAIAGNSRCLQLPTCATISSSPKQIKTTRLLMAGFYADQIEQQKRVACSSAVGTLSDGCIQCKPI
jgi:hypothetical protein